MYATYWINTKYKKGKSENSRYRQIERSKAFYPEFPLNISHLQWICQDEQIISLKSVFHVWKRLPLIKSIPDTRKLQNAKIEGFFDSAVEPSIYQ